MKLSVVVPTLKRLVLLKPCLDSIAESARGLTFETIVVDGGSTDGTLEFLRAQQTLGQLRLIEQKGRMGWVAAINAGFFAAQGEYVAHSNDDSIYVGPALFNACKMLDERNDVGQVAIHYGHPGKIPATYNMNIGGRLVLFANFGVTVKCLGDKVGWCGNYLYHYAGDNELSMQVWVSGCRVEALPIEQGTIVHYETQGDTRFNSPADTTKFYNAWRNFRWEHLNSMT